MNTRKTALTLVELIVVVTILSILSTVAFISFQGYSESARDSVRLSDIKSITKVLQVHKVKKSKYPLPENSTDITYSGSVAWVQGVFGISAYTKNVSMGNVPLDPITGLEYSYSVTADKREYQLALVLENPIASNLLSNTYAGTQEAQVYVQGNYNGKILRVSKDDTTYILGVPSIITSDITSVDLETIITNQKLVYQGYKNLPASYSGSIYNANPNDGFNFGGSVYLADKIILFEGNTQNLETSSGARVVLFEKLQASYSGSVISTKSDIVELLNISSNDSEVASNYVAREINNALRMKIPIVVVDSSSSSGGETPDNCPSNPNPDSDFTFDAGINTITGYTGSAGGVIIPCTIGGIDVLTIGEAAFELKALTSITIPEGVESIGDDAFRDNDLTSIIIPDSVTSIGDHAFKDNDLTSLNIPSNVMSISRNAFQSNDLTILTIEDGVQSIEKNAFYSNKLTSVTIPASVTSIGDQSFRSNQLINVNLHEGLTSIGNSVFRFNSITNITIPSSVTSIGHYAFMNNNLEANTIVIMCGLPIFNIDVFYKNGSGGTTDIPDPVTCL